MTRTQQVTPSTLPTTGGTGELIGYGRVSWHQLAVMLTGSHAAWADYNGFHVGPPPDGPPPYTHLWAWTAGWLARARLDGDTAIVSVLALTGEPQSTPPVQLREAVPFQRTQAKTWPADEKRVGEQAEEVASRTVDVYLIPGQRPITFVAVADNGI